MPSHAWTFTVQAASVHLTDSLTNIRYEFPINRMTLESDGRDHLFIRVNQSGVIIRIKASEVTVPLSATSEILLVNLEDMFYFCCT